MVVVTGIYVTYANLVWKVLLFKFDYCFIWISNFSGEEQILTWKNSLYVSIVALKDCANQINQHPCVLKIHETESTC